MLESIKSFFFKNKTKPNPDIFIARLRSTVIGEGMLSNHNVKLIDYAIKNMPTDGDILEIGLYAGLSSNLILHYLELYNKNVQLFGCDIWEYEGFKDKTTQKKSIFIDGKKNVLRTNYDAYIKQSYIHACQLLHPDNLPYAYHLSSDAFFHNINNNIKVPDVFNREANFPKKLSFCYIDGNHSYDQTKRDFENVTKLTVKGGFILLDDTANNLNFGSAKFAKELKSNDEFKIISKKQNYLIQKR